MEKPQKSNKPYIAIIVLLIAVIIGGGVYFIFFNKNESKEEQQQSKTINPPETADITDDAEAETYSKSTLFGDLECVKDQRPDADYCVIDSSKILNARSGITYTLVSDVTDYNNLAKVEIDKSDATKVTVKFDEKLIEQYYDTKGLNYPIYLTFSREVASYKIAGFGQGVGDEYIFFIMKDGTVGTLSVYSVVKDKKYNPYYVKDAKDVTAIIDGVTYSEYTGGRTTYAVRKDKTAYDLQTLLPSWGTD